MTKRIPTPVRMTITVSPEHDKILEAAALKKALPKATFIRTILADWAAMQAQARVLTGAERKALTA